VSLIKLAKIKRCWEVKLRGFATSKQNNGVDDFL